MSQQNTLRSMFEEHGAFVCRTLRALGVADSYLDDALQDVFLIVHRRAPDYQERGRLRSWLYSICTRVVWSRRRILHSRHEELVACCDDEVSEAQHDRLTGYEALHLGVQLLERLTPKQRDVFWLYEVEGRRMAEVARAIDVPLQTAYSRLHAARARISGA